MIFQCSIHWNFLCWGMTESPECAGLGLSKEVKTALSTNPEKWKTKQNNTQNKQKLQRTMKRGLFPRFCRLSELYCYRDSIMEAQAPVWEFLTGSEPGFHGNLQAVVSGWSQSWGWVSQVGCPSYDVALVRSLGTSVPVFTLDIIQWRKNHRDNPTDYYMGLLWRINGLI